MSRKSDEIFDIYVSSANAEFFSLSPFSFGTFIIRGKKWRTLIHYWCAMCFEDENIQETLRRIDTPEKALILFYKLGKSSIGECDPKLFILGVQERFNQLDYARDLLLCTGNANIIYKGLDYLANNNRYGKILMKVREIYNGN